MAKLILMFREKILGTYPLSAGDRLTIGRRNDNDIVIENLAVSGHHARIEHQGEHIVLTDLESKNGTFCNGRRITQVQVNHADHIAIGKHLLQADWSDTIVVEPSDEAYDTLSGPLDTAATISLGSFSGRAAEAGGSAAKPTAPRPEMDCLDFLAGGEGSYALSEGQVAIGINADADIVIGGLWAVLMGGPAAIIVKQAGDYFLRFTGGWIKPRRNGAQVKGTVKLNHEDVVDVGPVKLMVRLSRRMAA